MSTDVSNILKLVMRLGHWWWITWWRHQMETFSALLAIYTGNSPVTGEFPAQRPVARSFDVFFDLRLNKRLRKQSWGWWFETLSRPLWRHCNDTYCFPLDVMNNPCPDLNCDLLKPVKMDEYLYPKVCCGCNYISMSPTHLQLDLFLLVIWSQRHGIKGWTLTVLS